MQHATQLPQPRRLQSPRKLGELTASANNARQTSMLPPPPGQLKRKTLAEEAGEHPKQVPVPPSLRNTSSSAKATSITGISRQNSYSSSTTSRPSSSASSYRNGTNTSFGSNMGPSRVPSHSQSRSYSSMSTHSTQKSVNGPGRPVSSFDNQRRSARDVQVEPAINSMSQISSSVHICNASLKHGKKPWLGHDNQLSSKDDCSSSADGLANPKLRGKSIREISLASAMDQLSISQDHVSASSDEKEILYPQTPSRIPKTTVGHVTVENTSPTKSCRKTPKPVGGFLTKDSNVKAADWELSSRIENMESMYADLKASLSTSTAESNALKESNMLYKAKSWPLLRF